MGFLGAEQVFAQAARSLCGGLGEVLAASGHGSVPVELTIHGTTCLAIVNEQGVVMATDGRGSDMQFRIWSDSFPKIYPLDDRSLMAISGVPGIGIRMAQFLRARFSYEADANEGVNTPPETKANIIGQILAQNIGIALVHKMIVQPIFATLDPVARDRGAGMVFGFLPDGTVKRESDYVCCGSGGDVAKTELELLSRMSHKKPHELTLEAAKQFAVSALSAAHRHDAATGGSIDMKVIAENGIINVAEEEITDLKERIKLWRITL